MKSPITERGMPDKLPDKPFQVPPDRQMQPLQWWRLLVWAFVLALFSWFWIKPADSDRQILSYSEFKTAVSENQVAAVEFRGDQVRGEYSQPRAADGAGDGRAQRQFVTTLPPMPDPALIALLEQQA